MPFEIQMLESKTQCVSVKRQLSWLSGMLVSKISTPTKGLKEWARLFRPSEKGLRSYSSRKISRKQRMASAALALFQSGPWTFQPPEPSGINPPSYKHSHLQHFVKAKWNEEVGPCFKGRAGHNRKTSMSLRDWNVQPTPDFQRGNQTGLWARSPVVDDLINLTYVQKTDKKNFWMKVRKFLCIDVPDRNDPERAQKFCIPPLPSISRSLRYGCSYVILLRVNQ